MRIAKYILLASLGLTFARCGGEEAGPDAAANMKKNKLVRIATDAVNLPFEFGSGTTVQGMDVDIGNEIAKDLGIEVRWVKISGYGRLFEILQEGEAELLISSLTIDPDREKEFAFSEPYFESGDTIAHRIDNKEVTDLASLSGKNVGVQTGRSGEKFMATQNVATNVTISKFANLDDALGALGRREIDAVVGDAPILTYSIYKSFPLLITTGTLLNHTQYAVVTRPNDKELLAKVNETLQRLKKSDEIEALRQKWFQDVMELAAEQREKLRQEEELRKSPKSVSVSIVKSSGDFSMDRLDGFQLELKGESGTYQSTHIITNGPRGDCKFNNPIPPGNYRLDMSIFKMTTNVEIPESPSRSVMLYMNIRSSGITITPK